MTTIESILSNIERQWKDSAMTEILRASDELDLDDVYVAAFCLFYVDYTEFFPPHLGINTENRYRESRNLGRNYRWSPSEWKIELHDSIELLSSDYDLLAKTLADQSDEVWNAAIELHYQVIARVCHHLTTSIRMSGNPRFYQFICRRHF